MDHRGDEQWGNGDGEAERIKRSTGKERPTRHHLLGGAENAKRVWEKGSSSCVDWNTFSTMRQSQQHHFQDRFLVVVMIVVVVVMVVVMVVGDVHPHRLSPTMVTQ